MWQYRLFYFLLLMMASLFSPFFFEINFEIISHKKRGSKNEPLLYIAVSFYPSLFGKKESSNLEN